ncbi:MAG: VWA domain-containing protein [Deltaproteobacteria bacterium]|nr:VWA domain-containing protein [Deltaproteobacteria bacterium]
MPAGADPACESPNMLIVLDISGSMQDPPVAGGGGPSKFSVARTAIQSALSIYGNKVRFGLALFPWDTDCGEGSVRVPAGESTSAAITAELDKVDLYGATPIAATLNKVASEPSIRDQARRNFVLLITDGNDTCAADLENDPVNAAAALYASGIGVIVVGFGGEVDPNVLSNMARAGGYPRQGVPIYHQADSAADLSAALKEIIEGVTKEICDGKDNDCDGMIDEDDNGDPLSEPCTGHCGGGEMLCTNGAFDEDECNGPPPGNACGGCGKTPREECNGKDDDCDGLVDNRAVCPDENEVCVAGRCLGRCVNNECPYGRVCKSVEGQQLCVDPDDVACLYTTCGEGTVCVDGTCSPIPCIEGAPRCVSGVRQRCDAGEWVDDPCPEGFDCKNTVCVEDSCYTKGCSGGFICTAGACNEPDPCEGKDCAGDEFCRGGDCMKACAYVDCEAGATCRDGTCFDDPCAYVTCGQGKKCENGGCADDPCYWVGCGIGRYCVGGECEDDPCRAVECPGNSVCYESQCVSPGDVPVTEYPDGGSGKKDTGAGDDDSGVVPYDSGGGGGGGSDSGGAGSDAGTAGSADTTESAGCSCSSVKV